MIGTPLTRRQLFGLAALGGMAVACSSEPGPIAAADGPRPTQPVGFSLGSSILWADDSDVARVFDAVVNSGARSVRIDVSWTFTEPFEGAFDWTPTDRIVEQASNRGLSILATITNAPAWAAAQGGGEHTWRPRDADAYGRFCGSVAQRYLGRISTYEIWNEPNGQLFFEPSPDPEFYTEMLRAAYSAIKATDPNALVIGGALGSTDTGRSQSGQLNIAPAEFLKRMYDAGAQGHFDAFSYHPYDYGSPLANGTLYANSPMRQMIAMNALMAKMGDGAKKIWITEYGAPTSDVSEDQVATLITSSIQQWQEVSFAGAFYIYTVRDADSSSNDPEDRFGVITDRYRPKAAMLGVIGLLAAGIPPTEVAGTFQGRFDPQLGAAVSPVYAIGEGLGQEFETGSGFWSRSSYSVSPPAVAAVARAVQLVPYDLFSGGMQDLRSDGGFRVFSRSDTGTHGVSGSILEAWDPTLGFPISDEYTVAGTGQTAVDFEYGRIAWSPGVEAEITRQ